MHRDLRQDDFLNGSRAGFKTGALMDLCLPTAECFGWIHALQLIEQFT